MGLGVGGRASKEEPPSGSPDRGGREDLLLWGGLVGCERVNRHGRAPLRLRATAGGEKICCVGAGWWGANW